MRLLCKAATAENAETFGWAPANQQRPHHESSARFASSAVAAFREQVVRAGTQRDPMRQGPAPERGMLSVRSGIRSMRSTRT